MSTSQIPTTELADLCREESERYRRKQTTAQGRCYELFRRAIVGQDQEAWTAVYEQYRRLVGKWIGGPHDRTDERVNDTFAKFWRTVDPESFDGKFAGIGKVMAFLRLCARSVRIDEYRKEELAEHLIGLATTTEIRNTPADTATDNLFRRELFERLEQRLHDEQERLVLHLSFKVGLAPRKIAHERPDVFADVEEVRRIKERVVLRLSTDPQLQSWWEDANPSR